MTFKCCDTEIKDLEIWFLKDIKNFTARKILIYTCSHCGESIVSLYEKRIKDGRIYINENIRGINAIKLLYRERKRLLVKYNNISSSDVIGWLYGVNIEIKNKKGEITQLRQYSSDFKQNKRLIKNIYLKT